jgi:hypothetical protein
LATPEAGRENRTGQNRSPFPEKRTKAHPSATDYFKTNFLTLMELLSLKIGVKRKGCDNLSPPDSRLYRPPQATEVCDV